MTEHLELKIELAALAVRIMRMRGELPETGSLSRGQFERLSREIGCPVSARDLARFEATALRKARLAALALAASDNASASPASPTSNL